MSPIGWLLLAAVSWAGVALMVPRGNMQRLLTLGAIGGFGLSLVIQLLGVPIARLWSFHGLILPVFGISLLLPIAYWAEAMIFISFLPRDWRDRLVYITAFAGLNVLVDWLLLRGGYQVYNNWNLWLTFFLGIISHLIIAFLADAVALLDIRTEGKP